MGDMQVAYTFYIQGAKAREKKKGAGHYGMMCSSHKAARPRNKQLQLQSLFP